MEPQLVAYLDIAMILWLLTLGWVLELGREMADEEVMAGAVAIATVSVIIYTIFRF